MAAIAERTLAPVPARRRRMRATVGGESQPGGRDWLEYLALRAAFGALAALPLGAALRVGELAALVAYLLDRRHRRVGMRNLEIAFPEKPIRERRRILRASFLNLGRMAVELAHLPRLSAERLRDMVRFADEEWWREATSWERSTGVLVLSGHFGNWELLVFAHGMRGHPVHMVHRTIANPLLDRWLNALRARAGTRTIRKRHAARAVLAALHERGLLVLPFDQNSTRGLGVFVDFFGVPASTNAGLARIALRTDAPIVPAFIVREGRSARHRVHVLPIMQVERTGDPRADVVRNTQRFSAVFEDMVRRHPEQWLWMHKRWKTRPPGAPRLY
ncbi:MAG: lipid A biosynthesis acyltransferase [Deltaproteobacteria bacterium]|nr:MAG: lipid A biosynthesis acyltransferase [Deltaproteobacteria bacterium]